MGVIDLRRLPADQLVLHFGGRTNEINAYTLSNSLLALSQAIEEINRQLFPGSEIEISIEALGDGSFRTKIKAAQRKAGLAWQEYGKPVLLGVLSTIIYERAFNQSAVMTNGDEMVIERIARITVEDGSFVIHLGGDQIVLPKEVGDAKKALSDTSAIDKHVARTFEVLADDHSVTEFGIAPDMKGEPVGIVPRSDFGRMSEFGIHADDIDDVRLRDETARLVVVKAIFERSDRKWQFIWNGIRISAAIKDPSFFDKLENRQYFFGHGDIIVGTLRIYQAKEPLTDVYENVKYELIEVHDIEKRPTQTTFLK